MGPLVCDHFRAPAYFIESLFPRCMQNMKGFPCRDSNEFDRARCLANCKNGVCPEMGYNAVQNGSQILGKHFLYTTTSAPFCGEYNYLKQYWTISRTRKQLPLWFAQFKTQVNCFHIALNTPSNWKWTAYCSLEPSDLDCAFAKILLCSWWCNPADVDIDTNLGTLEF